MLAIVPSSSPAHSIRNRPSVRGQLPSRKLHYADNFELVAMRHREFRRSPNPSPEFLRRFRPVADLVARKFLATNWSLCALHGYEHGDLLTYALVWTTNFLGLYVLDGCAAKENGNERLLNVHLKQRFNELRALMLKKGRSCFPDAEAAELTAPRPL